MSLKWRLRLTRRGIGRGLAAIIPETAAEGPELRDLPLELIRPNPEQPRTRFDPASITSLAASIADAGIVQPLIVRPLPDGRYELIAGERRWRAAREAGVQTVPAIVRDEAEADRLQTALIENVAREDLSPVDEARACAALVEDLAALEGGAGPSPRPQPLGDLQPHPPARPAGRGARAPRLRRAQ